MPVTVVRVHDLELTPGHNNTILSSTLFPRDLGLPVSTHLGVLKPGMSQEPGDHPGVSKIYIPLEGEADLLADDTRYRLQPGGAYYIRGETFHEVRQVGEADFVNICISFRDDLKAGG